MNEPAVPVFRSDVESPEALLARVRNRLADETPATAPVAVDPSFDLRQDAGLLSGWYHAEDAGGLVHRWTARRFGFEADVRQATHLELRAFVFPESGLHATRGRLVANDQPGAGFTLSEGLNDVLIPLPAGLVGRTHFLVDVGSSWSPARAGISGDVRELGVSVRHLAFVRLSRQEGTWREKLRAAFPGRTLAARVVRRVMLVGSSLRTLRRLEEVERRLATVEERLALLATLSRDSAADCAGRATELREDVHRKLAGLPRS